MPKLVHGSFNQLGFAPIIVIVLLLGGVVAGTYLVQQRTNLLPKAFDQSTSSGRSWTKPTPYCKAGVKNFELLDECQSKNKDKDKSEKDKDRKYKAISFTCLDGTVGKIESEKKECRSAGHLKAKAREFCKAHQVCEATPSAKPKPSCVPVPECVKNDTCKIFPAPGTVWCDDEVINPPLGCKSDQDCPEDKRCKFVGSGVGSDVKGVCLPREPKPPDINCPQVITKACSKGWFNGWFDIDLGKVCQEFPTPCDVPDGWVIDDQELREDDEDNDQDEDGQTGACTEEARQCPDGSWVVRVGPKCEFAECPESDNQ